MIVLPGRIPIVIHPFFWFFAALIGWLYSQTILGTLIWVGIILFSVLFHEFGHALTAIVFRQKAEIQLVALGGLTSFQGPKLKFWQQFLIVLDGPMAGFVLVVIATFALRLPLHQPLSSIIASIQFVNLSWSIINLLPVQPLDGGQLLRIALEGFFGVKGFKASLLIGMTFAVLLSFYFFLIQAFLVGAFFFLFAFQSFDMWRKSRLANPMDRDEQFKKLFLNGESLFQQGNFTASALIFEEVRAKASGGILAAAATQYLATIYANSGRRSEAYELLMSCKDQLEESARCLLHQLAAEHSNFNLVVELSSDCYQFAPTQDSALRNARAFAALNQPRPAGGWLQTAWQHGAFDLKALLEERVFDPVRKDPIFRQFVDHLHAEHRQ